MGRFLVVVFAVVIAFQQSAAFASDGDVEPVDEVETNLPIGPIMLGSFGLVAVAVGVGFGWQAYEENRDFNKQDENGNYPLASHALADDIEAHAIAANVLMFGGLAVVAAGVLWWLLDKDYRVEAKTDESLEVSGVRWRPLLGPGRAGLRLEF